MIHALVCHGIHAHAMASWSGSKLTQWSKAYVELACSWPERYDMDVPMAVCTAFVTDMLRLMPPDEQIAL